MIIWENEVGRITKCVFKLCSSFTKAYDEDVIPEYMHSVLIIIWYHSN